MSHQIDLDIALKQRKDIALQKYISKVHSLQNSEPNQKLIDYYNTVTLTEDIVQTIENLVSNIYYL